MSLSAEDRLRAIIHATGAGTWEWNLDTGAVIVNDKWWTMLGYEVPIGRHVTYRDWEALCHPLDLPLAKEQFDAHLMGERPEYEATVRMRHANSRWRWIQTRGMLISHPESSGHERWVVGTHQDMTSQIGLKHQFEKLADSVPGVVYTYVQHPDRDGYFSYVSPKSKAFFGVPARDALSDQNALLGAIHPQDLGAVKESLQQSREGFDDWECDDRVRVGGRTRWMRAMAAPELEPDGAVAWHGLVIDVDEQKQLEMELERLSVTDELTGLFNRRHFLRRLEEAVSHSARYKTPFSLLCLDVDHFKRINDTLGHLQGDVVLEKVSSILQGRARKTDLVARTGGEEFVVLMPETTLARAEFLAEQLRSLIARAACGLPDGAGLNVTVSGGLIGWRGPVKNTSEVLARCDRLLYAAKDDGRNRIESALYDDCS